jgi:hypothetical protein
VSGFYYFQPWLRKNQSIMSAPMRRKEMAGKEKAGMLHKQHLTKNVCCLTNIFSYHRLP